MKNINDAIRGEEKHYKTQLDILLCMKHYKSKQYSNTQGCQIDSIRDSGPALSPS